MLTNYFCILNNIFFYIEYSFFIFYSFLGIIKIKNKDLIFFFIKLNTLFSRKINNNIIFFLKFIFLLINQGYTNKFKVIGVGYRQFYSDNIVVYKLRYNHLIYKILPFNILTFKKHKRRKYFTLFSLNKNELNKIMHIWLTYRIKNIYTKKGFFKKNKQVFFKEIIKKLL